MFIELESERLLLAEVKEHHSKRLYEIFSNEEVTRYYGMDTFTSIENAVNLIHSFQRMFNEKRSIRWGLILKENNELIGTAGFNNLQTWNKRAEIGYELDPDYWGKGLAAEAVEELLRYGYEDLGLYRIGAVTYPDNAASQRLLERHAFQKEGLLRGYIFQNGRSHDANIYSILKEDWMVSKERKVNPASRA
ncbi:GNAT family N-acetyltransferase [Peribacillus kribbensis]|uniref:GNAT family N-acetyltransferase n=1 Tax=Peribacillus kribbensis TaxID=356658 RepID=UPI000420CC18|nr:GNAT family protein [Peribacillus kribbensis]